MTQVRRRASALFAIVAAVIVLMACGRATDEQIDQALGITPTATIDPTVSAEETAAAEAAAASPGTAEGGAAPAPAGNPTLGKSKYSFSCAVCHRVGGGGSAPDLLASGEAGGAITYDELTSVIREGANHPPGPYETFEVTDADIANILAYLQAESVP